MGRRRCGKHLRITLQVAVERERNSRLESKTTYWSTYYDDMLLPSWSCLAIGYNVCSPFVL